MTLSVKLRDLAGELEFTLADLETFHDKDHFGGVVLSMKVLQLAVAQFPAVPHRDEVSLVIGLNPPGLVDCFELMTRAVTRRRLMIDPTLPKGPPSPFGRFHFEVHRPCGSVALWVREGLLPDDFATTGHKVENRFGTPEEVARWTGYKRDVGEALIPMPPSDVLAFERIPGRRFT